jgi:hypothetical protein
VKRRSAAGPAQPCAGPSHPTGEPDRYEGRATGGHRAPTLPVGSSSRWVSRPNSREATPNPRTADPGTRDRRVRPWTSGGTEGGSEPVGRRAVTGLSAGRGPARAPRRMSEGPIPAPSTTSLLLLQRPRADREPAGGGGGRPHAPRAHRRASRSGSPSAYTFERLPIAGGSQPRQAWTLVGCRCRRIRAAVACSHRFDGRAAATTCAPRGSTWRRSSRSEPRRYYGGWGTGIDLPPDQR